MAIVAVTRNCTLCFANCYYISCWAAILTYILSFNISIYFILVDIVTETVCLCIVQSSKNLLWSHNLLLFSNICDDKHFNHQNQCSNPLPTFADAKTRAIYDAGLQYTKGSFASLLGEFGRVFCVSTMNWRIPVVVRIQCSCASGLGLRRWRLRSKEMDLVLLPKRWFRTSSSRMKAGK